MGKHAFWMASFQCLAKSLTKGKLFFSNNLHLPCALFDLHLI